MHHNQQQQQQPSNMKPTTTNTTCLSEEESIMLLNDLMKKLVPELDSEYASFPMALERWHHPQEVLDNGEPCFIASSPEEQQQEHAGTASEIMRRQDYIWLPQRKSLRGSLPAGWYHLSTREAYIEVYSRLTKLSSNNRYALPSKRDRQLYSKITEIMENRLMCDVPNDVQAGRTRLFNMHIHLGSGCAFGKGPFLPASTLNAVVLSTQ